MELGAKLMPALIDTKENRANRILSTRRAFQKPLLPQPVGAWLGPGGAGAIAAADAEVVRRTGIDVQPRGHAGALQRQIHEQTMLGVADDVRTAMHEKNGWRLGWNTQAGGELVLVFCLQISRVRQNGEVGSAADLVNVVLRLLSSFVEAGRGCDGEMSARGEADHAYAFGVDAPLRGFVSHEADSALSIL